MLTLTALNSVRTGSVRMNITQGQIVVVLPHTFCLEDYLSTWWAGRGREDLVFHPLCQDCSCLLYTEHEYLILSIWIAHLQQGTYFLGVVTLK